jgi:prepilin-type N-terminal cleavage/methylation domain-containing protein
MKTKPAMKRKRDRQGGFTLIEALAALAISSVIITATVTLLHSVARNFDRGTRGVDAADSVMLATERLASDFGSARYVVWMTANGPALAFKGESARIAFVGSRDDGYGSRSDEMVTFSIERSDGVTRLVRRRAAWSGPDIVVDRLSPQDAVVLIEGNLDISFVFGRVVPDRGLIWSTAWIDVTALPRFVRLIVRDRATGADPIGEADFIVRADAPMACGRPDAGPDCLSRVLPAAKRRTSLERMSG